MKVMFIQIVIGAFCTVTKGLMMGLEDLQITERVKAVQTTTLLRSASRSRRVLKTYGDFKLQRKPFALADVKKSQGVKKINNLGQNTRPNNNQQQKKRIFKIVNFAVPADRRIKLKEYKNKDKYLDLAGELKKLGNMQVRIILIVIVAFGTVTEGLLKGLEDL